MPRLELLPALPEIVEFEIETGQIFRQTIGIVATLLLRHEFANKALLRHLRGVVFRLL
jgi:hypothetical protein